MVIIVPNHLQVWIKLMHTLRTLVFILRTLKCVNIYTHIWIRSLNVVYSVENRMISDIAPDPSFEMKKPSLNERTRSPLSIFILK